MRYEVDNNLTLLDMENSVFETILVERGHLFFIDRHMKRLLKAARSVLNLELNLNEITDFINSKVNSDETATLRVSCNKECCILSFRDVEYRLSGFLRIAEVIRDKHDIKYRFKTNDYKERLMELKEARQKGYLDSIYLNQDGFVTSCSIANVYFIKDRRVYTPSLETGVLDGIVRSLLMNNLDCIEGEFKIGDFLNSDGIFITNSIMGIMEIKGIGNDIVETDREFLDKVKDTYTKIKESDRRKSLG